MLEFVQEHAELHINVDLDKKVERLNDKKTKITILQSFCETGSYLTLFEVGTGAGDTNLSNRRKYEQRMFGNVYDGFDEQRPRYGNLNIMAHIKGDREARDYGKSFLILKNHVRRRCTITSCDSINDCAVLGTLSHCAHVLYDHVLNTKNKKAFLEQVHCLAHKKTFPRNRFNAET